MPKRTDLKKILIIGSGPIIISQACEFDYSGTQACKALREEGYEVVLINSNPATIMTDPEMADRTYIEPITPEMVCQVIERERPDAILPTLGGQTGLNCAIGVAETGILERLGVEMIGANPDVIKKAEDRELFRDAMANINLRVPKSAIVRTLDEAVAAAPELGYPVIVRPSFTLGGTGGGIAYNLEDLKVMAADGLGASMISEVMLEESVLGWKEFELEVMRDFRDNVVIICSIENLDPMGVHTGDSITVAPAQTLTDREYQAMRDAAIAIIREIGVETGGSNIQFAIHPQTGEMVVIEMNPRVSRSSALASKATGFPIAKIAAKLAVGFTLDEIHNDITRETYASFEPTIDYCVVKIPRWTFEKFPGAEDFLTTAMKSVGEVMAIGRTFKEALQKGIRSLEIGRFGLGGDGKDLPEVGPDELRAKLRVPNSQRLFYLRQAFRNGLSVDEVYELTAIDPWFLYQIRDLVAFSDELALFGELLRQGRGQDQLEDMLRRAKEYGFSDVQLGHLWGGGEEHIAQLRREHGVTPVYKLVDTCAAEFEAYTPYFYSTYEWEDEARKTDREKVAILGGGPNRIGQGIEFDYCCCQASFALKEMGVESIMVNSNPETVSTDYDTSDKLYFEPLTREDVLNIVATENPKGLILQFGGQTPLNLAVPLGKAGVRIMGTSAHAIDRAEDRKLFKQLLAKLNLKQPPNDTATTVARALEIAHEITYPVLVRPSYVLGGRAMQIVADDAGLVNFMNWALEASPDHPILIDKFLEDAIEVDVDAICDGRQHRHRRHHGAHRGGRHPLRRFGLRPAAVFAQPENPGGDQDPDPGHGGGAGSDRLDQHSIRRQGRRGLRPGGEPPGLPHRALRQQGHRGVAGQAGHQGDAGPQPGRAGFYQGNRAALLCREGVGLPLPALPRGGPAAGPGDALHRRSHGDRRGFRLCLCQVAAGRGPDPALAGRGAVQRQKCRQGRHAGTGQGLPGQGLPPLRHHRHRRLPREARPAGDPGPQDPGRPAPYHRLHQEPGDPPAGQHPGGPLHPGGLLLHPPGRPGIQHPLHHHRGRGPGHPGRHPGHETGQTGSEEPAGIPRHGDTRPRPNYGRLRGS